MGEKPSVVQVNTPDVTIHIPGNTPNAIIEAIRIAADCQFCRFISDLNQESEDELSVEAVIGPETVDLNEPSPPWFRVKFLIPKEFPYKVVQTIPLYPNLRWHPHQNGDWPIELDPHANVICPPRLSDIYIDELLLPYIRYAYKWTSDALKGSLINVNQRYEFPHLVKSSKKSIEMYIEGGKEIFDWVKKEKYGKAWLKRIKDSRFKDGFFRVEKLRPVGDQESSIWKSAVKADIFGEEEFAGWAPWIFAGNPAVRAPHQPIIYWDDFPKETQTQILKALCDVSSYKNRVPLLLVAFAIPKKWAGVPEYIKWSAVDLVGYNADGFTKVPDGFRKGSNIQKWPKVKYFIKSNHRLQWINCTDISREALMSRVESNAQKIKSLKIAIIGVGAVGSMMAKAISKLDVAEMLLIDKETLEPGNLVRHEALPLYVNHSKASSIKAMIKPIYENHKVISQSYDIISKKDEAISTLASYDLIIDATADVGVHEIIAIAPQLMTKKIAWCYITPGPNFGFLFLRHSGSVMTIDDAELKLKASVSDEVWQKFGERTGTNEIVWPEPGCYHPTFAASYHRLRMMSDAFLTTMISWIDTDCPLSVITLFKQIEKEKMFGIENLIETQLQL